MEYLGNTLDPGAAERGVFKSRENFGTLFYSCDESIVALRRPCGHGDNEKKIGIHLPRIAKGRTHEGSYPTETLHTGIRSSRVQGLLPSNFSANTWLLLPISELHARMSAPRKQGGLLSRTGGPWVG